MREILFEWNPWWEEAYAFEGVPREKLEEIKPWLRRKEIVSIVGVRRAGKTTLLYQIVDYLIHQNKTDPKRILFIKADDERVKTGGVIDQALDVYHQWVNPESDIFVFIDEVQEVKDWQRTLKRIYDLHPSIKLFISGSNATIVKEELSSLLAGRCAYFEVFPFSFREFLRARGVTSIKSRMTNRIRHLLIEYVSYGSFPEVVLEKDKDMKEGLVRFYFDSIFYRDIIKRKRIRNPAKLEKLVKYFLQNISSLANFSRIGKLLDLSTDSVGEYCKAMEEAYLVFHTNLYEFSYKKQIINPKKIYCVDLGIRNIVGFRFSEDAGRVYENLVYNTLRKSTKEIFYWKNKHECDFIVKEGKALQAIQVCYNLEESKERELQGLLEAMTKFGIEEGTIVTGNTEGEELRESKKIRYIPLWRFLLEE